MTEERWVVDRLEGDLAVVRTENGGLVNLPRWILPTEAGEGTHLEVAEQARGLQTCTLTISVNPAAGEAMRAEAGAILHRLRGRDPGGDLPL